MHKLVRVDVTVADHNVDTGYTYHSKNSKQYQFNEILNEREYKILFPFLFLQNAAHKLAEHIENEFNTTRISEQDG